MEDIKKDLIKIIKGISLSIITAFISIFIFAIVLTYTNISEQTIPPVKTVIIWISVLIGISEIIRKNKK